MGKKIRELEDRSRKFNIYNKNPIKREQREPKVSKNVTKSSTNIRTN